jgi:hypothetical protein
VRLVGAVLRHLPCTEPVALHRISCLAPNQLPCTESVALHRIDCLAPNQFPCWLPFTHDHWRSRRASMPCVSLVLWPLLAPFKTIPPPVKNDRRVGGCGTTRPPPPPLALTTPFVRLSVRDEYHLSMNCRLRHHRTVRTAQVAQYEQRKLHGVNSASRTVQRRPIFAILLCACMLAFAFSIEGRVALCSFMPRMQSKLYSLWNHDGSVIANVTVTAILIVLRCVPVRVSTSITVLCRRRSSRARKF